MRLLERLILCTATVVAITGCDLGSYEQSDDLTVRSSAQVVLVGLETQLSVGTYSPRLFSTDTVPFELERTAFDDPSIFEVVDQKTYNDGESYQVTARALAPGETTFHADVVAKDGARITNSTSIRATDQVERVELRSPCWNDEGPTNILFNGDGTGWLYATAWEQDGVRIRGKGGADRLVSIRTEPAGQVHASASFSGESIFFEVTSPSSVHITPKAAGESVTMHYIAPEAVDTLRAGGATDLRYVGDDQNFSVRLFAGQSEICSIDREMIQTRAIPADVCRISHWGDGQIYVEGLAKGRCTLEVSIPEANGGRGLSHVEQIEVGVAEH